MQQSAQPASTPIPIAFAISEPRRDGHTVALAVEGELDLATAPRLKAALDEIPPDEQRALVIDLSGVTFIDSTALRLLVAAQQRWHPSSPLAIVSENENVLRIFKIAGLELSFEIFASLEEALVGRAWGRASRS
jgi:anti-sigma B factor antagonist